MKIRRFFSAALLLCLLLLMLPAGVVQAQDTDEIKEYAIDITPQSDGSLIADYAINWCVISDAAGPLSWITLGMPNEQYEVLGYSGDVAAVSPDNSGFDYLVRIDLSREANAGDCVDIKVKARLSGMAYLDEQKNEVFFQFIPGWFNDVPVDHLKLTWNLPADKAQVKLFQPQPDSQTETQAVWETRLDAGDKFTVSLFYDPAAFPDLKNAQASASAPAAGAAPVDSGQTSSNPAAPAPAEASPPGLLESAFTIVCICIIIIVAIIILIIIVRAIASSSSSYRGGGYFGGYHGGGWTSGGGSSSSGGSIFGSGGGSIGRSDRSGGGSGLFGGRGSSCACVSSGCACACAGGGRAGCSRKGFDISSLFTDRGGEPDAR